MKWYGGCKVHDGHFVDDQLLKASGRSLMCLTPAHCRRGDINEANLALPRQHWLRLYSLRHQSSARYYISKPLPTLGLDPAMELPLEVKPPAG